jgi:acylphosphatase
VQGVFFRAFIKESADKLDIKGYVRNLEDGRVEAWIEGNSEEVEEMLRICRKGAPHSIVKNLELKEEKFQDLKEFKILHI